MTGRELTRRQLLGAVGLAGAGMGLAACGAGSSTAPVPGQSGTGSTGTVRMTVLQSGFRPAIEPAVADFTKQTGIGVEFIGYSSDQIQERTQLEISSGSATTDVYSLDGPPYVATMHQGLESLQPFVEREGLDLGIYLPNMLEMGRFPSDFTKRDPGYQTGSGTLFALPVRIGPHILHYRTDLLERFDLQPPKTLEEMRTAAQVITEGTNKQTYGVALEGAQGIYIVLQFYDFLWSNGGDVFDPTLSKCLLDDPKAVEATKYMVDLFQDGLAPPSTPSVDLDAAVALLQQGKAAMYPEYSPRAGVINDPKVSQTAGKWGWTTMPGMNGNPGIGLITGWSLGINKNSQNKDNAWQLIKYLTSAEVQLRMAKENANAPTVTSVFEDADYQKAVPAALPTLRGAQSSKARPGMPGILEVEQGILAFELNSALVGRKTPEQAMADAFTRISDVL